MHQSLPGGVTAAVLLVLIGTVTAAAQTDATARARRALDAGEPQQAVSILEAEASGRAEPAAAGLLVEALLAAGRVAEAGEAADRLARTAGSEPAAIRAIALARAARFDYDAALAALEAALQRVPGNGSLLAARGRILWTIKRTSSAIDALRAAAAGRDAAAEASYWLGRIYAFRGWQSEGAFPGWHEETEVREPAIEAFQAAARARPDWYAPHVGLGETQLWSERPAEALASFDAAIARAPNAGDAHVGRWKALAGLGRTSEIRTEVDAAAQATDPRMLEAARQGYELLEMKAESVAMAHRLAAEAPASEPAVHLAAGQIAEAARAREWARVVELAERFLEANPFSPLVADVADALLGAYRATPSVPLERLEAVADLRIKAFPDPYGYFDAAEALIARKARLPKVIQLAEAAEAAARVFVDENRASHKMSGKVESSLTRSRARSADLVGWAHFLWGDTAAAEPKLLESERLSRGQDLTNQFHLGEVARAKGELEIAREHYLTALTFASGPRPLKEAAEQALADIQTRLGNDPAEFQAYLEAELTRRRETFRTETLQSMVGKPLPAMRLSTVGGGEVDLQAERGNVVLLNFFASW